MKNTFLSSHSLFICLCIVLSLLGCITACDSQNEVTPAEDEQLYAENLVKSKAKFNEAMNARASAPEKQFTIKEISRKGSTLTITTEGGCSEESFQVIWDGTVAESYPMQIHLVLMHEQTSDNCQESYNHSIQVDLHTLLGNQAKLEDYHFHVHNGSAMQDLVLPGDKAVSN